MYAKMRNRKITILLLIVTITCLIGATSVTDIQSFQIKRGHLNRRLVSCTFLTVTDIHHHDCVRACFNFGGKCKSINFNTKRNKCELNAKSHDLADESEFEKNREYIFSDITEWPKMMSGCSRENCHEDQKCLPTGKDNFRCVDKANCGDAPPIDNGTVSAPVTLDGAKAIYLCDYGFENLGQFIHRKCQDGTWSKEIISCSIKDCGDLFPISHGSVSAPDTSNGSLAKYACNYGYEMTSGDSIRTCDNGQWNGSSAICTIKDCGRPSLNYGGWVSYQSTTHGGRAVYACYNDYELTSGDLLRICDDGTWTGSAAVCKPIPHVGCYVYEQSLKYNGTAHLTIYGDTCQRWDSQSPHQHFVTGDEFPETDLYDAHNYCRALNDFSAPLCYSTDPNVGGMIQCTVPQC